MLATTVADAARRASRCSPDAAPSKLVEPQPAAGRRSRCGRRCAGVRPDAAEPGRGRRRRAGCWSRAGHDAVAADPAYPTALGLPGPRHLVRRRGRATPGRRARPARAAAAHPPARRAWASGRSGAGWSRRGPTGPPGGERCDRLLRRPLRRPAAHPGAGRSAAAGDHAGRAAPGWPTCWPTSGTRRTPRRGTSPACPRSWCRSGRARTGCRSAVQLVGPPGSELLLLAVAGQFEMAAPWPRHAPAGPAFRSRRADVRPSPVRRASRRISRVDDSGAPEWTAISRTGCDDTDVSQLVGIAEVGAARELLAGVVRDHPAGALPAAQPIASAGRSGSSARTCSAPARTRCAARTCGSPG